MNIKNKLIFGGIATLLCGLFAVPLLVDHINNLKADATEVVQVNSLAVNYDTATYYTNIQGKLPSFEGNDTARSWRFPCYGKKIGNIYRDLTGILVAQYQSSMLITLELSNGTYNMWNGVVGNYLEDVELYIDNYSPAPASNDGVACPFVLDELIEISGSYTFSFNDQINFNFPFNKNINVPSVADINATPSAGAYVNKKIGYSGYFKSGNTYFDTIELYYVNAYHMYGSYVNNLGERVITLIDEGQVMYYQMCYYDSVNDYRVTVNVRNVSAGDYGGNNVEYYDNSSYWMNPIYKNIVVYVFGGDIDVENTKIQLNYFNNASIPTSLNHFTDDGSLSNAFELLGQAFSSLTSLLNITIVPGITIGLLLFLPLIAGVIVLIIWVVKR